MGGGVYRRLAVTIVADLNVIVAALIALPKIFMESKQRMYIIGAAPSIILAWSRAIILIISVKV